MHPALAASSSLVPLFPVLRFFLFLPFLKPGAFVLLPVVPAVAADGHVRTAGYEPVLRDWRVNLLLSRLACFADTGDLGHRS